ncbi:haloacid dehalogenase [Tessaracoccus lapidicaptus]|uniref:Beta-phosphoglucomutase n=1 Tax=Tessaracoccus lapidicaptus TaxID=1427523 RepID=A0A1C0AQP4_9ACTN|nr:MULTISPECIES: beta-phosphoglucomutase family hydrolase [Tessaracoccus]AQX15085.1 haloacid dehalogenase [Tessaracoccus sp. T2.5-30]OCL36603.1 haloacid dehalogenase [Tessaracoccus lapidicaptus]VEP39279.1 putative glycosyl hydrolase [Tessaracoccus lapidicaptus]
MEWGAYTAVLFDLDGVLTPTAEVHMKAWSEMFNGYLAGLPGQEPYGDADYFAYVDGKPRYDGVRDFLASRGILLPEGAPDDDPGLETVCGLGNRKNATFTHIVARDGVTPYAGSVALVEQLAADGHRLAVVSSSRNARPVLEAAGLAGHFPVVVDGVLAKAEGLAGKPAPDTFLRAAQLLGAPPAQAVVVEDAISGVAAGAAGGFGLVIGVDRGVGAEALRIAGAHVVVSDLAEVAAR